MFMFIVYLVLCLFHVSSEPSAVSLKVQKRRRDCGSPSFLGASPLAPRACFHLKVSQKKRKRLLAIES